MGYLHSTKRFAATAAQLHIIRQQIETYVKAHWRAVFHKDIQRRQDIGDQLVAKMPPHVRVDFVISQIHQIVDRIYADHATPELPEPHAHGWRA